MTVKNASALAIHGGTPARSRGDSNLAPGGQAINEEEEQAVLDVLRAKRLFRFSDHEDGESKADRFEREFASSVGAAHALAVTSGTAALICGLQGIGIGPGDEVILPAYTWMASATAVLAVGGIPVIAEIDESLTLDPVDVERNISPHTKAIMSVHMRGAPARMDAILEVADRHGLRVIEDCAQGNGASFQGRRLGSIGDVGCFSLQFSKIITTGEGGMVTTSDRQIWQRAFMFHDVAAWNRLELPDVEVLWGANFRMAEMPAAIGLVQLGRLQGIVAAARARKELLLAGISSTAADKGVTFRELPDPDGDSAISLTMFLETPAKAQAVAHALNAENISAGVLYRPDRRDFHVYAHWFPVLAKRAWTDAGGPWRWAGRDVAYSPDMCPRSLAILARSVVLNVDPSMTNSDVEETVDGVTKVLDALA
ncbi:MAG: DegT/DnrJ/EryC1/StrS family aminotransferase [Caldilineaceae bacterium SB0665_bin_25]|nr:DegT/DnrJ/EryC1/StrS family aminotransferase [Caldilineaceae bacterium SB0665_bin_25]